MSTPPSNRVGASVIGDGWDRVTLLGARYRNLALRLAIVAAAVVALATLVWHSTGPGRVDRAVATFTLADPGTTPRRVAVAVTLLGSTGTALAAAVVVGAWAWRRWRDRAMAVFGPLVVALAAASDQVLKHVVARPRPPTAVLAHEGGFSYPSGHGTAAAVCLLVAAAGLRRRQAVWVAASL